MIAAFTRRIGEWLLLFMSTILLVGAMRTAQLPAALLFGPIMAAIVFAVC
jgi:hypothetical protein